MSDFSAQGLVREDDKLKSWEGGKDGGETTGSGAPVAFTSM